MLTAARRPSAVVAGTKSEIDIIFDHESDFFPCYATHDQIRGNLQLKFEKDTVVDDVTISLEGQSMTYHEQEASTTPTTARTTSKHNFLRLSQPISADDLPEEDVAKAGVSYIIPFTFVVPEQLLPYSCSHRVESDEVKQMHLELPPSLGHQNFRYEGHPFIEDDAPDMAQITYSICAKVSSSAPPDQTPNWIEKRKLIRIVPARSEEPPMHVNLNSVDYTLCQETSVKRGMFKIGKIGKLIAETSQPRSLHLPHPRNTSNEPVTTMVTINLRFDPVHFDDQPPPLEGVVSRLKIYTFYDTAPYTRVVEPHQFVGSSTKHGMCLESLELSSRPLRTLLWTRQNANSRLSPGGLSRRPPSQSTSTALPMRDASENYQEGSPCYRTSILLPISLPTMASPGRLKMFPPTFHSCLISRIYAVELDLSYHTPGSNVGASHINLQVPVQISAGEGTPSPETEPREPIATEIERQSRLGERPPGEPELESPVYEEVLSLEPRRENLERDDPPEYRANADGLGAGGPSSQSVSTSAKTPVRFCFDSKASLTFKSQEFSLTSTRRRTISGKSLAKMAVFAVFGFAVQRD
ncbi:hypothetical protein H2200_010117 [Cladophialophora chaetospira]|uniref:Arrestin-like N-terminal domain-containing protein n=1 Tax=Cladophialophora chaetospira TaxID=386627 RepID=A0AA38X296_9EURO|nr:hypothetical protein H2200_010117 [Cladophialophora chaetospira]